MNHASRFCMVPILLALCIGTTHAIEIRFPEVRGGRPGLYHDPYRHHGMADMDGPHENTHGANSHLRNFWARRHGGRWNAIYCLRDKAFVVKEPPFRLSDIARTIPGPWRGGAYRQCLQEQQRDWNNRPLYVLDEWAAYMNGLECDLSSATPHSGIDFQWQKCLEFYGYAYVLHWMAHQNSAYDCKDLDEAFMFQVRRLDELGQRMKNRH